MVISLLRAAPFPLLSVVIGTMRVELLRLSSGAFHLSTLSAQPKLPEASSVEMMCASLGAPLKNPRPLISGDLEGKPL